MKSSNSHLHKAKKAKQDEFYTQRKDIDAEMEHYKAQFNGAVVYCNCDRADSHFVRYFKDNEKRLGLAGLLYTWLNPKTGDGDFRSDECVELLKEADIVVTNPPFSLFREYVAQLVEYKKQFLIVGHQGAMTYKEIFPLIRDNKMWMGVNQSFGKFEIPQDWEIKSKQGYIDKDGRKFVPVSGVKWFTNMEHGRRHDSIILHKRYYPEGYPVYDNFDAIEVSKVADIPEDYYGYMGVPITFMNKFDPSQFELVGIARKLTKELNGKSTQFFLNGKELYARIVIKRKEVKQSNYPFTTTTTQ